MTNSVFQIGDYVQILSPLPSETIYIEDYTTDIFQIVSQRRDKPNLYCLKNIQENTILECEYYSNNLIKLDTCSICGSPILSGQARQDKEENIICEDCFIEGITKNL